MRLFVMFDLPIETGPQRKSYRDFRKFLIQSGFLMLQKSVYTKIAPNSAAANAILASIRRNKPKEGLVQVLQVTEKQYEKMECIVGEVQSNVIDTDERLIVL